MLRVYCSWPGVLATMNFRLSVAKKPVGDVDGDALLALGSEAVDQEGKIQLAVALVFLTRFGI